MWTPHLFQKQLDVFNCNKHALLVSGPRWSGKTIGVLHKLIRHAWETPDARVAMFAKYMKNAVAGVWADICGPIMNEWLDARLSSPHADFGFSTLPQMDNTRTPFFKVRNYYGGESTIQMLSLDFDDDIEDKLFATRFSCIYFSELQHFESPAVLRVALQQLRMPGLRYEQHQWIADTNPPENGAKHFAYKIWFEERLREDHPDPEFQKELELIEINLDDNVFLDPKQKAQLIATYRDDPEAYDRFVLGKWTKTSGHANRHFSLVFRPSYHVVGTIEPKNPEDWEYLLPTLTADELISGWDLGHANHSWHALERILDANGVSTWYVLDELVVVGGQVRIDEFTEAVIEKRDALQKYTTGFVRWHDWTDPSAFKFNSGGTDENDQATVERVSDGRIRFLAATQAKAPGKVRKRVELIRNLLSTNRIFVSAHCEATIAMFKELRKGAKELDFVVKDEFKHPFDSLSYAIYQETLDEMLNATQAAPVAGKKFISASTGS